MFVVGPSLGPSCLRCWSLNEHLKAIYDDDTFSEMFPELDRHCFHERRKA